MKNTIGSKRRLLFVIPSLTLGGAERVIVSLINHLDKDKYDIQLVLFEDKPDHLKELQEPLKIVYLNKKNRWDFLKLIFRTRQIMVNYKPTAVISLLHYSNILVVLTNLFCRTQSNILISEHGSPRKYLLKARLRYLRKRLMKFTYRRANMIIAVSKSIKEELGEDFGIVPEKIKTIYNPIPLEEIKYKAQKKIGHPFFKDESTQVIISAGRLVELKRFDRLLSAFALLGKKQMNARLIILGKGEKRKDLEVLATQLNINKCVDFVGFKSDPYTWIANADLFVLSSDYEGLPMTLLEAMACGTPVISTDCPSGPGEIITNGKNGLLVPPGDEKALADAMLTLLRNKDLRKKFSEEGRKRAEDFRIEKILLQYEELFQ